MTNPELADKILQAVYNANGFIGSTDLAKKIDSGQEDVVKTVYEIKNYNDLYVRVSKGYGNNELMIGQNQRMDNTVALFLGAGGFTAVAKTNQQEKLSQQERNRLELQHLKLEIESLKKLPSEQKRNMWLSIAAILISLTALLIEIWKNVFQKP